MTPSRLYPPRPKGVHCASSLTTPHGEGHNAVCVCFCRYCVAERATLGFRPCDVEIEDGLRAGAPEQLALGLT